MKRLLILLLILFIPTLSLSHDFCASVYPCGDDGHILEQYNTNDSCGEEYRAICNTVQVNNCEESASKNDAKISELNSSITKLRKKLKRKNKALKKLRNK